MQLLEGAGPVVLRWCLVVRMVSVVVTEYLSGANIGGFTRQAKTEESFRVSDV